MRPPRKRHGGRGSTQETPAHRRWSRFDAASTWQSSWRSWSRTQGAHRNFLPPPKPRRLRLPCLPARRGPPGSPSYRTRRWLASQSSSKRPLAHRASVTPFFPASQRAPDTAVSACGPPHVSGGSGCCGLPAPQFQQCAQGDRRRSPRRVPPRLRRQIPRHLWSHAPESPGSPRSVCALRRSTFRVSETQVL